LAKKDRATEGFSWGEEVVVVVGRDGNSEVCCCCCCCWSLDCAADAVASPAVEASVRKNGQRFDAAASGDDDVLSSSLLFMFTCADNFDNGSKQEEKCVSMFRRCDMVNPDTC